MTLYISDLDGTLLDEKAVVNLESEQILNNLIAKGLAFSVATARTPLSALEILSALNLTLPLVLVNGCMIYDPVKAKFIEYTPFSQRALTSLAIAEENHGLKGLLLAIEAGKLKVYLGDPDELVFKNLLRSNPESIQSTAKEAKTSDVVMAIYTDSKPEILARMQSDLQAVGGLTIDFYQDIYEENRWFMEIFSSAASKKNGVLRLKELTNAKKLICFGDGANDLPMFEVCDEKYAVENAVDKLKAEATAIIEKNTDSGVARFIADHYQSNIKVG